MRVEFNADEAAKYLIAYIDGKAEPLALKADDWMGIIERAVRAQGGGLRGTVMGDGTFKYETETAKAEDKVEIFISRGALETLPGQEEREQTINMLRRHFSKNDFMLEPEPKKTCSETR